MHVDSRPQVVFFQARVLEQSQWLGGQFSLDALGYKSFSSGFGTKVRRVVMLIRSNLDAYLVVSALREPPQSLLGSVDT